MTNKLSIQNVLARLLGKKRFSIDASAKQFITSNPQWKQSLSEVINRDLPMKEAIDTMLAKYPTFEENIRKASNQDANIDIPGIFRNIPLDPIPNPAGDGGEEGKYDPPSNLRDWQETLKELGITTAIAAAFKDMYVTGRGEAGNI
jgi:predicted CopG family antitoxin